MGKSATQNGKDWEVTLWSLLTKYPGFRKDLLKANVSIDDLLNIDSKDGSNKDNKILKKELTERFLTKHEKMVGMRDASALRGDILCEILGLIIDIKNYASVQGTMKLKDLKLEDYIKGFDSNIKYPLFYMMEMFDFLDDHGINVELLKVFLFSKEKDVEWFKNVLQPIYNENKTVAMMSPSSFAKFFCFNECGYASDLAGIKPIKGFLSKVEDTVEFKVVDFLNNIKSSFVEVKLHIDEKGYTFFNFYDGTECIYILSQRGWDEKRTKRFGSNCSFINKNYMTLVSKVEIPKE